MKVTQTRSHCVMCRLAAPAAASHNGRIDLCWGEQHPHSLQLRIQSIRFVRMSIWQFFQWVANTTKDIKSPAQKFPASITYLATVIVLSSHS